VPFTKELVATAARDDKFVVIESGKIAALEIQS
jgi:hypothetical protein